MYCFPELSIKKEVEGAGWRPGHFHIAQNLQKLLSINSEITGYSPYQCIYFNLPIFHTVLSEDTRV